MKFGHYSNEELGIKRNLTCAMFDSKGAGIVPPKPEAGDVKCGENELDEAEMDNDIDEDMDNDLDESMSEDDDELALDNDIDEAEMSEDDEEIQAGLEDEAECGLDDETEMSEDELDAACGLDDEDMSEGDNELQCALTPEWKKFADANKKFANKFAAIERQVNDKTTPKQAAAIAQKLHKLFEEHNNIPDIVPESLEEIQADKEKYALWKQYSQTFADSIRLSGKVDWIADGRPERKPKKRLPAKTGRKGSRKMSNEIDKAQDVECAKKDWNKSFYTGEMHTALNSYTREHSFDGLSTDQRAKKLVEVFDRRLKATVKEMVADAKYDGADKGRVQYVQQLCEGIARENRNKWLKEFMSNYGLRPKKK